MGTLQEFQLKEMSLEYSRFVPDQVLTAGQLNAIIDFFEDQDRLTRTCLFGTGIVCGLHLKRFQNIITLSQGVAVTTDGDLIKMSETEFTRYVEYILPEDCKYDHFSDPDNATKTPKFYQLLTENDNENYTVENIAELNKFEGNLANWVGLLFLEYYLKSPGKCTLTNCDNLGRPQIAKPKVLLVLNNEIDKIVKRNDDFKDDIYLKYNNAYKEYFNFPVIRPNRVMLDVSKINNSDDLAKAYLFTVNNGRYNLINAINNLYKEFRFLIDKDKLIKPTDVFRNSLNLHNDPLYAQYVFDFYKDMVTAYNELRDVLCNVTCECIPNLNAFPKHVMLGGLNISEDAPLPVEYRHQFYPSPVVTNHKLEIDRAISMYKRIFLMFNNFKNEKDNNIEIRITPSKDYDKPLGDRSIPFYYSDNINIAKEWDYLKKIKGNDKLNYSYYTKENYDPLDYNIDEYDFFRVEGHIGRSYLEALEEINNIRDTKNLPFDIIAIPLDKPESSDIKIDDYFCQFEDLDAVYKVWKKEMDCMQRTIEKFFRGFGISKKGVATHESLPEADSFTGYIYPPPPKKTPLSWVTALVNNQSKTFQKAKEVAKKPDDYIKFDVIFANEPNVVASQPDKAEATPAAPEVNTASNRVYPEVATILANMNLTFNNKNLARYFRNPMDEEITTKTPMAIIEYMRDVVRNIPKDLMDINPAKTGMYRKSLEELCMLIQTARIRTEVIFSQQKNKKGYEQQYLAMLGLLSTWCCSGKKLDEIKSEIDRRKKNILSKQTFKQYLKDHPGLEHKAGVHRGGTFVIVYTGNTFVIADFCLPYISSSSCLSVMSVTNPSVSPQVNQCQIDMMEMLVNAHDTILLEYDRLNILNRIENADLKKLYSEVLLTYSSTLLKIHDNSNYHPELKEIINIKDFIERLNGLPMTDNEYTMKEQDKAYSIKLFIASFVLWFGVLRCTECSDDEIPGIVESLPNSDSKFGGIIEAWIVGMVRSSEYQRKLADIIAGYIIKSKCSPITSFLLKINEYLMDK